MAFSSPMRELPLQPNGNCCQALPNAVLRLLPAASPPLPWLLKFITAWVDSSVFQVKSPLETLLGLFGCWVSGFRINFQSWVAPMAGAVLMWEISMVSRFGNALVLAVGLDGSA
ncbi:hypothetical protein SLEP1_g52393 [Rubroshorea leprosula]|uniref:Uncharacterized protein n=1 Tax=Rubroshorea leprosula TaxID=152421 RepID=A0AAV5M8R7_9ROSI|nr:hypothetical protein SLEP1_g52393 [Rubroshorea leprosula]